MGNWLLDMDSAGRAAQEERINANTRNVTPEPGAMAGFGTGIGMHAMRAAANVGRTAAILGAAPLVGFDAATGGNTADSMFKGIDDYFNPAVDYWTPKAGEVGKAGEIVGGLVEGLAPLALGPAGVPAMLGNAQVGTAVDLQRQGVDSDTAQKVGLVAGVSNAVGFKIPFLGNNIASRVVSGATGNLAVNSAAQLAQQQTLKAAGNTEQAAQFDPANVEARALDILMGGAFGVLAHAGAPAVKPSAGDAALALRNARKFQQDSAPGAPVDQASSAAHQAAMEQAMGQLMRGEKVEVANQIANATFLKMPETNPPATVSGQGEGLLPRPDILPTLKTEADMRVAAAFTPAEQAHSEAYERSTANLRELTQAVAKEKNPAAKAILQTELDKQTALAAKFGSEQPAPLVQPDVVALGAKPPEVATPATPATPAEHITKAAVDAGLLTPEEGKAASSVIDALTPKPEAAAEPAKPTATLPQTPEVMAARQMVQESPETPVLHGYDADGKPTYRSVSDSMADIDAEHQQAAKEASAYEAAANCFLRRGQT